MEDGPTPLPRCVKDVILYSTYSRLLTYTSILQLYHTNIPRGTSYAISIPNTFTLISARVNVKLAFIIIRGYLYRFGFYALGPTLTHTYIDLPQFLQDYFFLSNSVILFYFLSLRLKPSAAKPWPVYSHGVTSHNSSSLRTCRHIHTQYLLLAKHHPAVFFFTSLFLSFYPCEGFRYSLALNNNNSASLGNKLRYGRYNITTYLPIYNTTV